MSAEDYAHPDHGNMVWVEYEVRGREKIGWKCEACHVIGHPDRADSVFDEYGCEHHEKIRKKITGGDDA